MNMTTFAFSSFSIFTVLYRARENNGHLTFKIEVFFNKFKKALELTDNTFGIFFHNQLFLIMLRIYSITFHTHWENSSKV